MLQAPEGDLLTNCNAVMKLAVPGTGGEFLEVHCESDTTALAVLYSEAGRRGRKGKGKGKKSNEGMMVGILF